MKSRFSIVLLSLIAVATLATGKLLAQERIAGERTSQVSSPQAVEIAEKPATIYTPQLTQRSIGSTATATVPTRTPQLRSISATAPILYGSIIYADGWSSDNAPYGIYSFPATANTSVTAVHLGNNFEANGGGTYVNG